MRASGSTKLIQFAAFDHGTLRSGTSSTLCVARRGSSSNRSNLVSQCTAAVHGSVFWAGFEGSVMIIESLERWLNAFCHHPTWFGSPSLKLMTDDRNPWYSCRWMSWTALELFDLHLFNFELCSSPDSPLTSFTEFINKCLSIPDNSGTFVQENRLGKLPPVGWFVVAGSFVPVGNYVVVTFRSPTMWKVEASVLRFPVDRQIWVHFSSCPLNPPTFAWFTQLECAFRSGWWYFYWLEWLD